MINSHQRPIPHDAFQDTPGDTLSEALKGTSFNAIQALVKDDLSCMAQVIIHNMQNNITLIPEISHYIISAGGKRIRPLLTLLAAHALNYTGERHINLAACVEFIHTATLLHDDVVDVGDLRRGQPTANIIWGNEASVLVGDYLFARAFQLMVQDQDLNVLGILSDAAAQIAQGEVHQLMRLNDLSLSEHDYFDIIKSKTAALFAAAAQVGGLVSAAVPEICQALRSYGYYLGIVFQITDDVLDYHKDDATLGKIPGQDFKEGKVTLPVILALKHATLHEKEFWTQVMQYQKNDLQNFDQALQYFETHQVFAQCFELATHYANQASANLQLCPPSIYRQAMDDLITITLNRICSIRF